MFSGILKVEGESRDGAPTPPPSQDDIPDLLRAQYFMGGVSPGFSSPLSLPPSFLGCMANINVAQEGYSPTRGQYWGVQPGCSNKVSLIIAYVPICFLGRKMLPSIRNIKKFQLCSFYIFFIFTFIRFSLSRSIFSLPQRMFFYIYKLWCFNTNLGVKCTTNGCVYKFV